MTDGRLVGERGTLIHETTVHVQGETRSLGVYEGSQSDLRWFKSQLSAHL